MRWDCCHNCIPTLALCIWWGHLSTGDATAGLKCCGSGIESQVHLHMLVAQRSSPPLQLVRYLSLGKRRFLPGGGGWRGEGGGAEVPNLKPG